MDIPFPTDVSDSTINVSYTILFDNGTTASVPLSEMSSILPAPPVDVAACNSQDSLLPPFLRLNSKITYEHDGQYHKGTNLMSINATKIGGLTFPICWSPGLACVSKEFLSLGTSHTLSYILRPLLSNLRLIPLPLLSVRSTCIRTVRPPF
jgi:hypothetical protein